MRKGLMIILGGVVLVLSFSGPLTAQVYKVVDESGNVVYTDQPPADGSGEMVLPEVSVIEIEEEDEIGMENETADVTATPTEIEEAVAEEPPKTPRELRRMYRDFRILSPSQEESFWGTENSVVVSWGASAPYETGMAVSVVINGESQEVDPNTNLPVTLERGEHEVYAVLRDPSGRRIVTTPTVTFFIHQASRLNNPG